MSREKIFRFKQFSVRNDRSAMKVGTDGVLLGAWANVDNTSSALDIGTGTGLIALMIAQRSLADITAVEIDEGAVSEAKQNFKESPWSERLHIEKMDFNEYAATCKDKFDLIISNPPYFIDSLKCPDDKRGKARHTDSLSYDNLIFGAANLLSENGRICLITPSDVENIITSIVSIKGLTITKKTLVYPTQNSPVKRILWQLSKVFSEYVEDSLCIEIDRHEYTKEYLNLTRDYYLKF